jgi:tRNA (guanine-N7-)-methyltransferase
MRIRQHVNPLRSEYLRIDLAPLSLREGWPTEVELGSAEAHFLMGRAAEEPRANYIGVEIRRELVEQTNQIFGEQGLSQVRSVFANMSVDLPRLFPAGSVRRFFINFPDPWFKFRQKKRRVVSEELVADLWAGLAALGEVHVATDIFDIALDAMAALEGDSPRRFVNAHSPWTFARATPFEARSRRERHCEATGIKIWRLVYRKV